MNRHRNTAVVFAVSFCAFFLIACAWNAATPLTAGPDEPNHFVAAYAVGHGDLGRDKPTVSGFVDDLGGQAACYAFRPDTSAACLNLNGSHGQPRPVFTQFGAYNPSYYALIGWPSTFLDGRTALYAVRGMSGLIVSLVLAAALTIGLTQFRSPWVAVGLFCGLTPVVGFLTGVVNTSAFEIATAALAWVALLAVLQRRQTPPSAWLITTAAIALAMLINSRMLSPLWAAAIVATVLVFTHSWGRLPALLRRRSSWFSVALLAVASAGALLWTATHKVTFLGVPGRAGSVGQAGRAITDNLLDDSPGAFWSSMTGMLGWLDTPVRWAPLVVLALWTYLCTRGFSEARASRSQRVAFIGLVAAVIAVPSVLEGIEWSGVGWQGRYTLPLAIGIPVLAGAAMDTGIRDRARRFPAMAVVATVALCNLEALLVSFHRYAAGMAGSWMPSHYAWHAPFGIAVWLVAMTVAYAAFALLVARVRAPGEGQVPEGQEAQTLAAQPDLQGR